MSVFGRSRRDPVQGEPLLPQRFPYRGTAGQVVSTQSAMTVPAVWACVRLRADVVSSLPLNAFRRVAGVQLADRLPQVLVAPSGNGVTLQEWLYMSQVSLDLRGNAYGKIQAFDGLGYPTVIEMLNPDTVFVDFDKETGALRYRVNGVRVDANEMWHERAFTFPGIAAGLSPIQYAAVSVGISLAAEQFGAGWFSDGAHPSGMLTNDKYDVISDIAATSVKTRFMNAIRGTREPVVMGNGWKYTQLQIAPGESQFLETMKFGVGQICRLFGVPPEMVGGAADGASITYANIEQRSIDFLTYGIGPTLVRRENALSKLLPSGANRYVKFDTRELLRTDTLTRAKSHQIALQNRYELVGEVRALEDLEPLTPEQMAELQNQFVFSAPAAVVADQGTDDGIAT